MAFTKRRHMTVHFALSSIYIYIYIHEVSLTSARNCKCNLNCYSSAFPIFSTLLSLNSLVFYIYIYMYYIYINIYNVEEFRGLTYLQKKRKNSMMSWSKKFIITIITQPKFSTTMSPSSVVQCCCHNCNNKIC